MRASLPAAVAALVLAGCAGPVVQPAATPPAPTGSGPAVRIGESGAAARQFAEAVAARCLLDGVVGGAAMIVDRASGRVLIVGDEAELVALDVMPAGAGSRIRLSGPAVADPVLRDAMVSHIERAARTGDTSCPMLPA